LAEGPLNEAINELDGDVVVEWMPFELRPHPEHLARLLLRDRLAREPDLIQNILAGQNTRRLPLSKALPVFVLYQTPSSMRTGTRIEWRR